MSIELPTFKFTKNVVSPDIHFPKSSDSAQHSNRTTFRETFAHTFIHMFEKKSDLWLCSKLIYKQTWKSDWVSSTKQQTNQRDWANSEIIKKKHWNWQRFAICRKCNVHLCVYIYLLRPMSSRLNSFFLSLSHSTTSKKATCVTHTQRTTTHRNKWACKDLQKDKTAARKRSKLNQAFRSFFFHPKQTHIAQNIIETNDFSYCLLLWLCIP